MPPLEERPEYPYQNIRTRNYPWGNGDKVCFSLGHVPASISLEANSYSQTALYVYPLCGGEVPEIDQPHRQNLPS